MLLWIMVVALMCPGCSQFARADQVGLKADKEAPDHRKSRDSAPTAGRPSTLSGVQAEPLRRPRGHYSGPRFELLAPDHSGVDFQLQLPDLENNIKQLIFLNAFGGICTGDFDGDGLVDFYVSSPAGGHKLYRNLGDFRFQDATEEAGLAADTFWGTGATFVDIDNDGDLDLYACAYDAPNRLYVNRGADVAGNIHFQDQAHRYGLDFRGASMTMAFADIDNDGDLDGYLATTAKAPPPGTRFSVIYEGKVPKIPPHLAEYWQFIYRPGEQVSRTEAGQFDHLYRNDDGHFVDISREAGIDGPYFTLSATWWDFNADSLPDLYVANDFYGPDMLYRNDGDGQFTEVIQEVVPHTPWFSMGSDVGDVNNDGLVDFLATDMSATTHYREKVMMGNMDDLWFLDLAEPRQYMRNALYVNSGTGRMLEAAYLCGVASTDWTWNPLLADLDNDGRLDLFVTNGILRDTMNSDLSAYAEQHFQGGSREWARFWAGQEMRKEVNLAFRNEGDLQFTRTEQEWGLNHAGVSLGAAVADFDNDGDMDLVVSNADAPVSIYRNKSQDANSITVRLAGTASNRRGLGATVHLRAGGVQQVRYVTMTRGWLSSSAPVLHFGLGDAQGVSELSIDWPSGRRQVLRDLGANQAYIVSEPDEAEGGPHPVDTARKPFFAPSSPIADARHTENEFDDFAKQPLLPHRMSMMGPALAAADIDDDGDEDFFLGGAAGQSGRLVVNHQGQLQARSVEAFDVHQDCEDTAAVFLDVESDGDEDLVVVSGSVEQAPGNPMYRDRLYLNDGHGGFTFAPDRLPDDRENGSVAAACDYDLDGDADLFIGSRCVPGEYPTSGTSRLLVNSEGRFEEAAPPALADCGMVTDAVWADLNQDGRMDLTLATDWGPLKVFLNEEGRLRDATRDCGLDRFLGWWTAITAADVDGDGDQDLVAGNFGLNTKYRASQKKPELLYYGVFDESERPHVIEAKYDGDVCVPRRGFSCSQNAMPFLKDKLQTFHNFASATLPELYGQSRLADAVRLEANTLESGIFINEGSGEPRFTFRPLPRLAQIAPSLDLLTNDFNSDGNVDLFMLHNFYGPQRETGRMDGGLSLLLLGDGTGGFEPVWPVQSGIVLPADPRRAVVTDLDADGGRDLFVAINDGAPVILRSNW
jgi:hypothetical protein